MLDVELLFYQCLQQRLEQSKKLPIIFRHVYGIEYASIVNTAKKIVNENGYKVFLYINKGYNNNNQW